MGRKLITTIFAAVGIVWALVLISGCDEQNNSDIKRARLIAEQDTQLKKEIEQLNKKLENLSEETKKQKEQLDACLQKKKDLEEEFQNALRKDVNDILSPVLEETAKLREENEKLKAQIPEPNKQPGNKPSQ